MTETFALQKMDSFPPEIEEGNVEYKLKLVNLSDSRFEHLVTQMKWRLEEGEGEAIYEIGVEDNGMLAGLTSAEMDASLHTLTLMAQRLGAEVTVLRKSQVNTQLDGLDVTDAAVASTTKTIAEVLVRKIPDNQHFIDLRLAVLGNVDAGKSTLLGVLTQGELDNGRGRARLNLFRHLHEIQSGRTSSISHEILGFNSNGEVINYSESRTVGEICDSSTKLITFMDLCGHQKYLKTTIFGLTGSAPDFAMLVISANKGIVGTTKEHLGYALALQVPIFVVITKIDMCRSAQIDKTVRSLEKILKSPGSRKIPFRVENDDDALTAASQFHTHSFCPIFKVSSVTGVNLELITQFLNVVPPLHNTKEREQFMQDHTEFYVDEIYSISGVGPVVGGTLVRGIIREGDTLLLGPSDDGKFLSVSVGSLHRNRLPCRMAAAGHSATVSLSHQNDCVVRKGMVLLSNAVLPTACMQFQAEVYILFHSNYICRGFQTVIHVGNVRQTATIIDINKDCLRTNEKALVTFRFINKPEYIRIGSRLLLREGRTKGMGEVTNITPYTADTSLHNSPIR